MPDNGVREGPPSRTQPRGPRTVRRVAADALRVTGAAGSAQAIALAAAPLITRAYEPSAYGRFAVVTAIIALLLPLASLRYEFAIVLPEEDRQALDLLGLCIVLVAGSSLVVGVLAVGLGPLVADATNLDTAALMKLPVAFGVMGLHGLLVGWLVRERAVAQLGMMRFATVIGTVVAQIGFSKVLAGTSGLVLGLVVGHAAGIAIATRYCKGALLGCLAGMRSRTLRRTAVDYRAFAIFTAPGGVVNVLGYQIPSLVLPALYGPAIAGQSNLAQRVVGQPAVLLGSAVNQVFWADAARLFAEEPERLWHLFLRMNLILLAVMVPGVALTFFGGDIFAFLFGAPWRQAGTFAGIFVLAEIAGLPAHATTCLHGYGLNSRMSAWDVGRLTLVGAMLFAIWRFGMPPLACVIGMSGAFAAASLVLFALNARAILRRKSILASHGPNAPRLLAEAPANSA